MSVRVGDVAPDFTLPATGGHDVTLSSLRGKPVVLVFYPGDNTPVCTEQLNSYTRDISRFDGLGAQVLAMSPEDVASHDGFSAAQGGFAFPLLADTEREVAAAYGVLGPLGAYRRSVVIIDDDGVIRYIHRSIAGLDFRPVSELVAALESLHA